LEQRVTRYLRGKFYASEKSWNCCLFPTAFFTCLPCLPDTAGATVSGPTLKMMKDDGKMMAIVA